MPVQANYPYEFRLRNLLNVPQNLTALALKTQVDTTTFQGLDTPCTLTTATGSVQGVLHHAPLTAYASLTLNAPVTVNPGELATLTFEADSTYLLDSDWSNLFAPIAATRLTDQTWTGLHPHAAAWRAEVAANSSWYATATITVESEVAAQERHLLPTLLPGYSASAQTSVPVRTDDTLTWEPLLERPRYEHRLVLPLARGTYSGDQGYIIPINFPKAVRGLRVESTGFGDIRFVLGVGTSVFGVQLASPTNPVGPNQHASLLRLDAGAYNFIVWGFTPGSNSYLTVTWDDDGPIESAQVPMVNYDLVQFALPDDVDMVQVWGGGGDEFSLDGGQTWQDGYNILTNAWNRMNLTREEYALFRLRTKAGEYASQPEYLDGRRKATFRYYHPHRDPQPIVRSEYDEGFADAPLGSVRTKISQDRSAYLLPATPAPSTVTPTTPSGGTLALSEAATYPRGVVPNGPTIGTITGNPPATRDAVWDTWYPGTTYLSSDPTGHTVDKRSVLGFRVTPSEPLSLRDLRLYVDTGNQALSHRTYAAQVANSFRLQVRDLSGALLSDASLAPTQLVVGRYGSDHDWSTTWDFVQWTLYNERYFAAGESFDVFIYSNERWAYGVHLVDAATATMYGGGADNLTSYFRSDAPDANAFTPFQASEIIAGANIAFALGKFLPTPAHIATIITDGAWNVPEPSVPNIPTWDGINGLPAWPDKDGGPFRDAAGQPILAGHPSMFSERRFPALGRTPARTPIITINGNDVHDGGARPYLAAKFRPSTHLPFNGIILPPALADVIRNAASGKPNCRLIYELYDATPMVINDLTQGGVRLFRTTPRQAQYGQTGGTWGYIEPVNSDTLTYGNGVLTGPSATAGQAIRLEIEAEQYARGNMRMPWLDRDKTYVLALALVTNASNHSYNGWTPVALPALVNQAANAMMPTDTANTAPFTPQYDLVENGYFVTTTPGSYYPAPQKFFTLSGLLHSDGLLPLIGGAVGADVYGQLSSSAFPVANTDSDIEIGGTARVGSKLRHRIDQDTWEDVGGGGDGGTSGTTAPTQTQVDQAVAALPPSTFETAVHNLVSSGVNIVRQADVTASITQAQVNAGVAALPQATLNAAMKNAITIGGTFVIEGLPYALPQGQTVDIPAVSSASMILGIARLASPYYALDPLVAGALATHELPGVSGTFSGAPRFRFGTNVPEMNAPTQASMADQVGRKVRQAFAFTNVTHVGQLRLAWAKLVGETTATDSFYHIRLLDTQGGVLHEWLNFNARTLDNLGFSSHDLPATDLTDGFVEIEVASLSPTFQPNGTSYFHDYNVYPALSFIEQGAAPSATMNGAAVTATDATHTAVACVLTHKFRVASFLVGSLVKTPTATGMQLDFNGNLAYLNIPSALRPNRGRKLVLVVKITPKALNMTGSLALHLGYGSLEDLPGVLGNTQVLASVRRPAKGTVVGPVNAPATSDLLRFEVRSTSVSNSGASYETKVYDHVTGSLLSTTATNFVFSLSLADTYQPRFLLGPLRHTDGTNAVGIPDLCEVQRWTEWTE